MSFRLLPSFHPRHHLRRTFRLGPLRLHVGGEGVSWGPTGVKVITRMVYRDRSHSGGHR